MRLSEILNERSSEKERCTTCDGLGKEFVGDELLVFDCPDCEGTGYFDDKASKMSRRNVKEAPITDKIAIGNRVMLDMYNALTNQRSPTEVEIVDYVKRPGERPMVYYKAKGTKVKKLVVNVFKTLISKQELEEIKVTKTVAGKKQTPSRQLAMKKKKTSPNQGKEPVELDKVTKSMKDLSNEILKGEYTNTREFGK